MQEQSGIDELVALMARLRDPEWGCPWDLKQDYRSITTSTIEEAYEVVDTIQRGDLDHLKEELGDLLFQCIFYSQLAAEEGRFDFHEVIDTLVKKLVRRHPHVFPGGTLASRSRVGDRTGQEVKQQWETIKLEERSAKGQNSLLDDIPVGLPALTRAGKLQKRAASVGFDWDNSAGVLEKMQEELHELQEAVTANDKAKVAEELGDALFTLVNFARHVKLDAEECLRQANRKFTNRFDYIEKRFVEEALSLDKSNRDRMEQFWEAAKRDSAQSGGE